MGSGSSGMSKGGGGAGGMLAKKEYPEAFAPGKDFEAVNGVDHDARTVSRTTQAEWEQYAAPMYAGTTPADEAAIMRDWSVSNGLTGYVRTQNSFAINKALYDPKNDGKTVDQIFRRGADRTTVKTLDNLINGHSTPSNGMYTRFCSPDALQSAFGLTNAQMKMIKNAKNLSPSQLDSLNASLRGTRSFNPSYTSTSANRSLNAFKNPKAKQSKGFIFERRISTPKGTKAYAPRKNAQESEVIFGRKMQTAFSHLSISPDGHIVIHEFFDGYR